jgi:MoxR-like ATPase
MFLAHPGARVIFLHGPPGTGKTYAAFNLGRIGRGVCAVTLTPNTNVGELRGRHAPCDAGPDWCDGPFVKAMRDGARLVINELNHAGPDVTAFLHPILDSERTAQITLPTNEIVRPAPGFHIVATANAPPECLPAAIRDRLDYTFHITEPHPDALAALPPSFQEAARRTSSLPEGRRVSPRAWEAIHRAIPLVSLEQACMAALGRERGLMVFEALMRSGFARDFPEARPA